LGYARFVEGTIESGERNLKEKVGNKRGAQSRMERLEGKKERKRGYEEFKNSRGLVKKIKKKKLEREYAPVWIQVNRLLSNIVISR